MYLTTYQHCNFWTIYLPAYLFTYLPAYQTIYLPTELPACLPACLTDYLTIYLPAWLTICLPACLPAWLPLLLISLEDIMLWQLFQVEGELHSGILSQTHVWGLPCVQRYIPQTVADRHEGIPGTTKVGVNLNWLQQQCLRIFMRSRSSVFVKYLLWHVSFANSWCAAGVKIQVFNEWIS